MKHYGGHRKVCMVVMTALEAYPFLLFVTLLHCLPVLDANQTKGLVASEDYHYHRSYELICRRLRRR